MKKNLFLFVALLCSASLMVALSSCGGSDDEPTPTNQTGKVVYLVRGIITSQEGEYMNGQVVIDGANSDEFKFYKGIYDKVAEAIAPATWEVTYNSSNKQSVVAENDNLANEKFKVKFDKLKAIQQTLNETDKNAYHTYFTIKINLSAGGETTVREGEMTIKYQGNPQ